MKNKKRKLDLKIFKIAHLTSSRITGGGNETNDDNTCQKSCKGSCSPDCDVPVIGNGQKSKNDDTKCPSRDVITC